MEFINRNLEMEELEKVYKLSKNRLFPILIFGARRIGKTRLVEEFCKEKKSLYFFVYESKGLNSLLKEFERELKEKRVIDEHRKLNSIDEFIEIIFKQCRNWVIVFDEVQYMLSICKPFFSLMQRKIDEEKDYPAMFIFLGSVVGLVKRVFEDLKSPLYGRMKNEIILKSLKYKDTRKMLFHIRYRNEQDFINFYGIFGGYPKYYVAMEDYQLRDMALIEVIKFLFFRENAPLKNEVANMLRQEFGRGKSYYYDILEAIATGHTKLSEIASYVGKHQTDITPFIRDLIDYYELIKRESIITEDPKKSRNSIYLIRSPIIKFWFRFVYPNLRYFELNQFDFIVKRVDKELNSYTGRGFEEVCKELIAIKNPEFNLIGKWWGHYRKDGERKSIEIDIVALNEKRKEILFGECKWKNKINATKVIKELVEKAEYVKWFKDKRKESFVIFAKSFKKKIKEFDGKKVYCFDLKDIGRKF